MDIEDIRDAVAGGGYRITDHATKWPEMTNSPYEKFLPAFAIILTGEVIEEYRDDKPFPSCLIFCSTPGGDSVHTVWGYNANDRRAVLITAYRPDHSRWIEWRVRR